MKKIIAVILSIVMTFSLIFTSCLVVFKCGILNADFYINIATKKNIYSNISDSINSQIKDELIKNNIVIDESQSFITEEECKEIVNDNFKNIFSYMNGKSNNINELDLSQFLVHVDAYVEKYLNENNIEKSKLTNDVKDNLNNKITKILKNNLDIMLLSKIVQSNMFSKFKSVISIVNSYLLYACLFIDVFLMFIIISLFKKNRIKMCNYLSNSYILSGLFLDIVFFSGFLCKNYRNAPISPEYLKVFFGNIIGKYFVYFSVSGVVLLLIGLLIKIIQIGLYNKSAKIVD